MTPDAPASATSPSPSPAAAAVLPSVCIIVLNYNGRRLLGRFLPPIMKTDYAPLEVVVVDNASSDDSRGWLRARWPQVTVLHTPVNRGWPGGNNIGIRYALEKGHRYIALANNDIEPHPSWIRRAVEFAQAHPDHGIVGFQLFNQDRTRPAFETTCRHMAPLRGDPIRHIVGCAMLCDSEVFRAIGLLDEDYVNYAEETDWEHRATQAGWRMAEINAPVWHLAEATMLRTPLRRCYLQMRSSIRFTFKLLGIAAGVRMCVTVLNRACNPWLKLHFEVDYTFKRYRPSSLPVNALLALSAIAWNLVRLPRTLYCGHLDKELIARCRAKGES
ncbi:MAG: glycosyltransferase family 2 protein [Verrucomicrobia bacterium]|nr:glycosyltransferase family 2 protein [Verrucomicrobiota bacterium]